MNKVFVKSQTQAQKNKKEKSVKNKVGYFESLINIPPNLNYDEKVKNQKTLPNIVDVDSVADTKTYKKYNDSYLLDIELENHKYLQDSELLYNRLPELKNEKDDESDDLLQKPSLLSQIMN